MVERNLNLVAPIAAAPALSPRAEREDVPWLPTPRAWMRSLAVARTALLVPLAGATLTAVFLEWIHDATALFLAIAFAAALQAVLYRSASVRATLCLVLAFVVDVALLGCLVFHSGGLRSPLLAALMLPGVAAFFTLKLRLALVPAVATLLTLGAIAFGRPLPAHAIPEHVALLVVAAIACAAMAGAFAQRRRERYLEHRIQELDHSLEDAALERALPRVVDWEEMAPVRQVESARASSASARSGGMEPKLHAIADLLAGELRDPAGSLRARAEVLRSQARDRARRDDLLPEIERLLRTADRLDDVRLTLGILGNASAESAHDAVCDVRALIVDLRAQLADAFERDGVRLRIEAPRNLPFVAFTPDEFRLLLTRLLESSRRTALGKAKSARVGVRFVPSADEVQIEIEDNLPIANIEDSPRDRSDSASAANESSSDRRPGLSLALAVARHLLAARGGEIAVDRRKGGGLLLQLKLPTARKG